MITPQQLRDTADAIEAHERGEPIECRLWGIADEWAEINPPNNPSWGFDSFIYRPKPKPKKRPWSKPEDVPGPVCWLRISSDGKEYLVYGISGIGLTTAVRLIDWNQMSLPGLEYSVDRKTWHPCTVEE